MKSYLRSRIKSLASYLEIILSICLIVVIVVFLIKAIVETVHGVSANTLGLDDILSTVLTLAIAVEFVKMLASHSSSTVIEVLLFAIARHMIVGHGSMVDTAIGVACIAGIFATRKFLFTHFDQTERNIYRGNLTVHFANRFSGARIPEDSKRTLKDVIKEKLQEQNEMIAVGAVVEYKSCALRIERMNGTDITRVEVIRKT